MNIEDLTIKEARALLEFFNPKPFYAEGVIGMASQPVDRGPWEIGKTYLIRTVTMIQTGRCVAIHDKEICLEDAAWIADTGRFSDALVSMDFGEVEPFPDGVIFVGRGSIIDVVQVPKSPRIRK